MVLAARRVGPIFIHSWNVKKRNSLTLVIWPWNQNGLHPMSQNKWQQHLVLPFAIEVSEKMAMEPQWLATNFTNKWRQHLALPFAIKFS